MATEFRLTTQTHYTFPSPTHVQIRKGSNRKLHRLKSCQEGHDLKGVLLEDLKKRLTPRGVQMRVVKEPACEVQLRRAKGRAADNNHPKSG